MVPQHRLLVWNSRRGPHLGSGRVRPHQQTGHMIAIASIRRCSPLVGRGPSTYGSRIGPLRSPSGMTAECKSNVLQRTETFDCPACGRATAQRFLYAKNGCDIFRCEACGLGRSQAAHFDPAAYYTEDYFSGQHADGYGDYIGSEPVLRREFAHTVDVIRRYRPSGRLIELGCAYGFFLQEAKKFFDVAGIELAADAAAHARRKGLDVVAGVADTATLQK